MYNIYKEFSNCYITKYLVVIIPQFISLLFKNVQISGCFNRA